MNIGELAKFRGGVSVDTVNELTSGSGVTLDSVLLKDGEVTASGTNGVITNTISERSSGSGVTIDSVLLKDGEVQASGTNGVKANTLSPIAASGVIDMNTTSAVNLPIGGTAARPGSPGQGDFRFNSDEQKLEVYTSTGWTAAGSGGTVVKVTQTGLGVLATYPLGTPLYLSGSTWTKADATTSTAAEVVGLISKRVDNDNIEVTLGGEVPSIIFGDAFAAEPSDGSVVFLSETAGKLAIAEPTTVGYISKPLGVVRSKGATTCSVMFTNMRGTTVGGTNLFTSIGLSIGATTVQNLASVLAAGQSCKLEGTVKYDGTADFALWLTIFCTRQPDGTTYDVSYSVAGGTAPAGFTVSNSTSSVQITLPADAGFVSATYTFSINGVSAGATLPLSINPSLISGAADISCQSGYGISFGNETLKAYDEGTWTPVISSQTGSITSYTSSGTYVRIGRQVTLNFSFNITNNGTGATNGIMSNLPFTANANGSATAIRSAGSGGHTILVQLPGSGTGTTLWKYDNTYPFATGTDCVGCLVYQV